MKGVAGNERQTGGIGVGVDEQWRRGVASRLVWRRQAGSSPAGHTLGTGGGLWGERERETGGGGMELPLVGLCFTTPHSAVIVPADTSQSTAC